MKRTQLFRRAAIIAALATAAVLPLADGTPGRAVDLFVTRSGTQLMLDGEPYRFSGFNVYNANSDGWCWYQMDTGPALGDALLAMGPYNDVIRAWFFQWFATDSGARDWSAFDHTLDVARQRGVRVIVTLANQWGDCEPGAGFRDQAWYEGGYSSSPDPSGIVSYRDWVAEVVTRYKDDPAILMWQLINEAEVQPYLAAGCPSNDTSADVLKAWATDVSGLIKSIDANHLVSLGTIGGGQCGTQGSRYQDVHDITTIDVCEYHDYGSALAPMPGDQWNGLQVRIDQCNALNKPIFVGETGVLPGDTGGTLAGRASALTAKLDAQFAAGVSGVVVWAWSNLGSTLDNYDVGAGDPLISALALGPEEDTDGDGCSDGREAGPTALSGGLRDPLNEYDFYDVNASRKVDAVDIAQVRGRFDVTPPYPNYAASHDRSPGAAAWAPGAPNGVINAVDIGLVRASFNHSCIAPP